MSGLSVVDPCGNGSVLCRDVEAVSSMDPAASRGKGGAVDTTMEDRDSHVASVDTTMEDRDSHVANVDSGVSSRDGQQGRPKHKINGEQGLIEDQEQHEIQGPIYTTQENYKPSFKKEVQKVETGGRLLRAEYPQVVDEYDRNETITSLQLKVGRQITVTSIKSDSVSVGDSDVPNEKRKLYPVEHEDKQKRTKQDQVQPKIGKQKNIDHEDRTEYLNKFVVENSVGPGFNCSICKMMRPKRLEIRRHLESIHFPGRYQYICNKCKRKFDSQNAYMVHKSNAH